MTGLIHSLRRHWRLSLVLPFLLGLALLFWPARTLRSDNFVFYVPGASHVVPIQGIEAVGYLPILQILNSVGRVQGITAAKDSLKIFFNDTQIELHQDDKRVRVDKEKVNLSNPVRILNGQFMVPLSFIETVLPRVIHESLVYHVGSRRAFVGDVKPESFSFRLEPVPDGARLTLDFSDRISVKTASTNGKWVLFLGGNPVQPLEQKFNFQDQYLSNIQFDDQDGTPKLILTPKVDGLNFYSKLDSSGKILTAELLKTQAASVQPPPSTSAPQNAENPPQPGTPAPPVEAAASPGELSLPMVVLDASHGGDDTGARGGNGLLEKDLVAQLTARVRSTLLATKKYRIVLTRVGDVTPTFDQRAATANAAHARVFVTFHAGNLGVRTSRIVIYTLDASSLADQVPDSPRSNLFIPWDSVQPAHLAQSQQFGQILQKECTSIAGATVGPLAKASLRELRGVNSPAVAVEIGSLAPDIDPAGLTSTGFQGGIANAIARALEAYLGGPS